MALSQRRKNNKQIWVKKGKIENGGANYKSSLIDFQERNITFMLRVHFDKLASFHIQVSQYTFYSIHFVKLLKCMRCNYFVGRHTNSEKKKKMGRKCPNLLMSTSLSSYQR